MVPQLTAKDGYLYLGEHILIRCYPAGDCDTINWPFGHRAYAGGPATETRIKHDRENLAVALYDAYETGLLSERTVALPDGTAFNIDNNMPAPKGWDRI